MAVVRRGVFVLIATVAALMAVMPSARAQTGAIPVVVLDGKGWGHGVGLSQWGAKYMADAGAAHEQILSTFYPGTALADDGGSAVRVSVYTAPDGRATLTFPNGGEVRSSPGGDQAAGFPIAVAPGGAVVVSYDGTYHATPVVTGQSASKPAMWSAPARENDLCDILNNCTPSTTTTQPPSGGGGGGGGDGCILGLCTAPTAPPATAPPTSTTAPPPPSTAPGSTSPDPGTSPPPPSGSAGASSSGPLWGVPSGGGVTGVSERGRHYRGLLEVTAGGGPLRLVNQLDVETYLKGMGEVPGDWPIEAVSSQAVVARTYALRAMSFSGEICDYDLCQVYIGADRETAGQAAAVDATRGQVLTYGGAMASTVYSADAGGITATTLEGFGSPDGVYPYLTTVKYNTPDPLPWRSLIALSDVANRFGYSGDVTNVTIGQPGPSGRALAVTLDGSSGPMSVDGRSFASKLGLRSTLFAPTITTSDSVPPPPPLDGGATQALPEDAATIRQAALVGAPSSGVTGTVDARAMREWGSGLLAGATTTAKKAVKGLADRPSTLVVLALVGLATALAASRWGTPDWLLTPALAGSTGPVNLAPLTFPSVRFRRAAPRGAALPRPPPDWQPLFEPDPPPPPKPKLRRRTEPLRAVRKEP
ncbi:MAG: stage sporulation protein [Acidimicrobiaceae bacterium]